MEENNKRKTYPQELILSLDIGTRSVVGIVGKMEAGKFIIIDVEMVEHPSRAMYDGQIHDIDRVVAVAQIVKERLEKRINTTLKHVAIAAAGRALKTFRTEISKEIDYSREIDNDLIKSLEMEGVQRAQEGLEKENAGGEMKYYCVGHTVVSYYLNDGLITSLRGHRGNRIGADIIATFLPHVVVDSLYAVMDKLNLEVLNLTLEPIAAINAAIPQKLRLLNLALVDIGAGTSDIAITKDGTVVAYGMAPVAGDEITEAIAKEFLLDFDSAEKLKIQLSQEESHSFNDIVGMTYTMSTDEIVERIKPAIETLASEIGDKIVENNGKAPSVVFCIGGGSQVPGLTEILADKLQMITQRVVVRGTELIENIDFLCDKLEGPEYITPIGIGLVSLEKYENDFIVVTVNNTQVKLFNTKRLMISDALIKMGFNARNLIARRGKGLTFKVNGKEKTVKGGIGEPAEITLNNKKASLDSPINNNDIVHIKDAIDGMDTHVKIKDIVNSFVITFNGVDVKMVNNIRVNGKEADMDYTLQNNDELLYNEIYTIKQLLDKFKLNKDDHRILVNGQSAEVSYRLKSFDQVSVVEKTVLEENSDQEEIEDKEEKIEVWINGEKVLMKKGDTQPIFVDIFEYIDFDITQPKGVLQLILNGERANYTDLLDNGDNIEIRWEK